MNYRQGLHALEQAILPDDEESRHDMALYKAQLLNNLRDEERFGSTETVRTERWRIVDKLNPFALQLTGVSFTDLCAGTSASATESRSLPGAPPTPRPAPSVGPTSAGGDESRLRDAPETLALELTFELTGPHEASVRWESDVLGVRQSRLVLPYSETDLPLVLNALDYLQSSQGHPGFSAEAMARLEALGLAVSGLLTLQAHRAVGTALFRALTQDTRGGEALATARNMSIATGAPLAISLHFSPDAVALAALPWELLWDERPEPLLISLGREATLNRHLDLAAALPPARTGGRSLGILPVIPQAGVSAQEHQEERAAREAAWAALQAQGDAEMLKELRPATRAALFDRLDMLDTPPDILHFVGHGKYLHGEGHLILDEADGGWEPTPVSSLAAQLRGIRLVVLVSCQSAALAESGGPTLAMLTGAATAISAVGVPLVLAMQLTVRKTAAYRFLEIFYRNLARGRSVQEALSRGRHGLYAEEGDGASWYVPVLYVRSRERKPVFMVDASGRETS